MRKLKHSHIVEYVGIGSTDRTSEEAQRNSMFLVSELMDGGTLKKVTHLICAPGAVTLTPCCRMRSFVMPCHVVPAAHTMRTARLVVV